MLTTTSFHTGHSWGNVFLQEKHPVGSSQIPTADVSFYFISNNMAVI